MATNSLEQQALDRVARMYAGYDRRPPHGRPANPEPAPPPAPDPEPPAQEISAEEKRQMPPAPEKPAGLLDALMEDKEQSLILLLLVILMKDGADMDAVLALMYLLI